VRQEQIQILLHEHDTLRTEILQRLTSAYQVYGVVGTSAVAISVIMAAYSIEVALILFILLPFIIWFIAANIDYDLREIAAQLRDLERRVNELAGATLLTWETEHGGILPGAMRRRAEHIYGPFVRTYNRWRALLRTQFKLGP